MTASWRAAPVLGLLLAPALFAIDAVRQVVEGRMLLHMLLQFPLLAASGAAAAWLVARHAPRPASAWHRFDGDGLFAVLGALVVSSLWMLPVALDAAVLQSGVAAGKYASWWLAGAALRLSWHGLRPAMHLFLAGNLGWMLATAGLLYAEAEQRLCVSYRYDEQAWTGVGLCAAAVALFLQAARSGLPRSRGTPAP
jgi:hypothetical protein